MMRTSTVGALISFAFVLATASVGCKGSAASEGAATGAASSTGSTGSANTTGTPSTPQPTLPEKGPWEAAKVSYTNDDPADGSPTFKLENLGSKTISVCFVDYYGYDAAGKQVAHKELSWNGTLKGGEVDAKLTTAKVDGVKTWEATYHGIRFDTDKEPTMDYSRAPATRAMGASSGTASGASGAATGAEAYSGLVGRWISDWGAVKIEGKSGTYTDTYGGGIGQLEFTQTAPRQYAVKWSESKARHGTMTVTLSDDDKKLEGTWTPDPDCTIGSRSGGSVHWVKRR